MVDFSDRIVEIKTLGRRLGVLERSDAGYFKVLIYESTVDPQYELPIWSAMSDPSIIDSEEDGRALMGELLE